MLKSFPLYRRGGLGAHVVEDAVDGGDFGQDAGGNFLEEGPGELLYFGGHGVAGVHGAYHDGPGVDAAAVADAGAGDGRDDGKVLPHGLVEARGGELLAEYRVALAHGLEPVAGDSAGAAHAEAGAREGLAVDHGRGSLCRRACGPPPRRHG